VGERWRVFTTTEYGFSSDRNKPDALKNSAEEQRDLYFDIKVIHYEHETSLHKMTTGDKFHYVEERRMIGKKFFTEQRYQTALRQYDRAIQVLTDGFNINSPIMQPGKSNGVTIQLNDTDMQQIKHNEVLMYINASQCYYKLQRYTECLESLNKAIKIDDKNVKALYRRSTVHRIREDYQLMLNDLKRVKTLMTTASNDSTDKNTATDLTLLKTVEKDISYAEQKIAAENAKERATFGGMFSRQKQQQNGNDNGIRKAMQSGALNLYDDVEVEADKSTGWQRITRSISSSWQSVIEMFRRLCQRKTHVE
jgi:tetratricopeptide (TPR) repeat protein